MNKLSVERRKELGERLYEIGQEIAAIRKEVGVNSLIIGAWRGSVNAYGFLEPRKRGLVAFRSTAWMRASRISLSAILAGSLTSVL